MLADIIQTEKKKKRRNTERQTLNDLWDSVKQSGFLIFIVLEGYKNKKESD